MTDAAVAQAIVVVERTYPAPAAELWALWTTKAGFESWWGPRGCHVEVRTLEARPGGPLIYNMIADAAEAVAATEDMGLPAAQTARGRFGEFRPHSRLTLVTVMDFIPGVAPYDHTIAVDFFPAGESTRMVVTTQPHFSAEWTRLAVEGFNDQLAKLDERYGTAAQALSQP